MKQYLVKDIPVGSRFSRNLFLDGQFILSTPELSFSKELKDALFSWNLKEVFSAGELIEDAQLSPPTPVYHNDSKMKEAKEFYDSFLNYMCRVFMLIKGGSKIDFQTIADKVRGACPIIQNNRSFLLRLQKTPGDGEDYLASHGVTSMIISIIIGLYLKLPEKRIIELGVAALLHEIGMFKISPKLYLKKEELTPDEWKVLSLHPLFGYNLLKSFDFPLAVSLVALEHHERENGSGYPRKLTADKISLYSKIVAVACSYEALTTDRPYRYGYDGHSTMLDLLKNNSKQYNETIVKALLYSLSLYPIGLFVQLSNKKKGQVVDVNPENPRFPIVQLLEEFAPDGQHSTIQTASDGIFISGLLSKDEVGF